MPSVPIHRVSAEAKRALGRPDLDTFVGLIGGWNPKPPRHFVLLQVKELAPDLAAFSTLLASPEARAEALRKFLRGKANLRVVEEIELETPMSICDLVADKLPGTSCGNGESRLRQRFEAAKRNTTGFRSRRGSDGRVRHDLYDAFGEPGRPIQHSDDAKRLMRDKAPVVFARTDLEMRDGDDVREHHWDDPSTLFWIGHITRVDEDGMRVKTLDGKSVQITPEMSDGKSVQITPEMSAFTWQLFPETVQRVAAALRKLPRKRRHGSEGNAKKKAAERRKSKSAASRSSSSSRTR